MKDSDRVPAEVRRARGHSWSAADDWLSILIVLTPGLLVVAVAVFLTAEFVVLAAVAVAIGLAAYGLVDF